MSENIPESIPTSADPRSHRPTKKARWTSQATAQQSVAVETLFSKGVDRDIVIPTAATTGPRSSALLAPPPEIVANVQGSSAGAGSGEFHVYKASRRREYERVRLMDEEAKREEADAEWEKKREEQKAKDAKKTSKNAKRREKAKAKKTGGSPDDNSTDTIERRVNLTAGRPKEDELSEADGAMPASSSAAVDASAGIVIHDDD